MNFCFLYKQCVVSSKGLCVFHKLSYHEAEIMHVSLFVCVGASLGPKRLLCEGLIVIKRILLLFFFIKLKCIFKVLGVLKTHTMLQYIRCGKNVYLIWAFGHGVASWLIAPPNNFQRQSPCL